MAPLDALVALTRKSSPAGSVAQGLAARIAIFGLNFGTGVIMARSLLPTGRGESAALGLWAPLLAGIATCGLPAALIYRTRRDPARAARLLTAALMIAAVFGLIVGVVGLLIVPLFLRGYDRSVIGEAQLLMIFVPQILLNLVLRAHYEATGNFHRTYQNLAFAPAMTLVALSYLYVTHRMTPFNAALSYFIPSVLLTIYMLFDTRAAVVSRLGSLEHDVRSLLSYGVRSSGLDIVNTLSAQADQAVIVGFMSAASLGYYALAIAISRTLLIVQQSVTLVLFPAASALPEAEAIPLIERLARITCALTVLSAVAAAIAVPVLVPLVYGAAFAPAVPITLILLVEAALSSAAVLCGQAFNATGRPGTLTLVQCGWLATTVLLLFGLVPRFGLEGAAIALVASAAIRLAAVLALYPLLLGRPVPRLIVDIADLRYAAGKIARPRRAEVGAVT